MAATKHSLAQTLTRLRKGAGLSLYGLGAASGVNRSVISRVESGEYQKPSPATLNRLAAAMNTDASELLTAAGYTANEAEALPSIRPYLRTKYGHLSATAQKELAEFLDRLETEEGTKRAGGQKTK